MYQDATFEHVCVGVAAILMKFLLMCLVVGCCWSVEKLTRIFLENQLGFGANLTPVPYSKMYQDATFEPVCVRIAPILMKFLLVWLVVGCCRSIEKLTRIFLKNQPAFETYLTPVPYSKVYQDASFEPVYVTIASKFVKFLLMWLVVVWCCLLFLLLNLLFLLLAVSVWLKMCTV